MRNHWYINLIITSWYPCAFRCGSLSLRKSIQMYSICVSIFEHRSRVYFQSSELFVPQTEHQICFSVCLFFYLSFHFSPIVMAERRLRKKGTNKNRFHLCETNLRQPTIWLNHSVNNNNKNVLRKNWSRRTLVSSIEGNFFVMLY